MRQSILCDLMYVYLFVFLLFISFSMGAIAFNEILLIFGYSGFLEVASECGRINQ